MTASFILDPSGFLKSLLIMSFVILYMLALWEEVLGDQKIQPCLICSFSNLNRKIKHRSDEHWRASCIGEVGLAKATWGGTYTEPHAQLDLPNPWVTSAIETPSPLRGQRRPQGRSRGTQPVGRSRGRPKGQDWARSVLSPRSQSQMNHFFSLGGEGGMGRKEG